MNRNVGFLSPTERNSAVVILQRRLAPEDMRALLKAIQGDRSRRRSVEWIVAEAESGSNRNTSRLRSRLPDEELAAIPR